MALKPLKLALLLTLVLLLPALYCTVFFGLRFAGDDFWHQLAFEASPYPGGPTASDLFRFASGLESDGKAAMQDGAFPWYSDPALKISFFRPLSTALHNLDHWLFPGSALAARVHSIAWYVALVGVVWLVLARLVPRAVAVVALFVFTCAAAHWQPVVWIAARNALISAVFACTALLCYVDWRRESRRPRLLLALGCYALAIAGGESALGMLAYLAAYEVFMVSGSARSRVLAVLPFLALSLAAVVLYSVLGYGVARSGAYLHPLSQPASFLTELPSRLLAMLSFSYLGVPADLWFLKPAMRAPSAILGLVAAVWMIAALRAVWRALDAPARRSCLWGGVASLGAMVPQAAGLLGSRSLTLPSLGTSVVIATLLVGARRLWAARDARLGVRLASALSAVCMVFVHFVVAPASWFTTPFFYSESMMKVEKAVEGLDLERAAEKRAVLLQVADPFVYRYLPYQRRVNRTGTPQAWHALSQAPHDHVVKRTGPNSFELEVIDGEMLGTPLEAVARPPEPMPAGYQVELDDFTVRVLDAGAVGPRRIALEFRQPLDHPEWLFLAWQERRLVPFRFPELGESVRLRSSPGPTELEL